MKLRIPCMQCLQEDGKPSDELMPVEMRDDGLYKVTCPNGHITITAIQEQKFEILFDLGAMALLDGYPREAVSSIAASLERFFEFYIQVIAIKQGIHLQEFNKAWKHVSSQSERQYGAFLFFYLLDHRKALDPPITNVKPTIVGKSKKEIKTWIEFRNSVIHKGYIPSTEEVVAYGDIVYRFVNELIADLKRNSAEQIQKVTFDHLARAHQTADGKPVSTMSIPTLISIVRGEGTPASFEEALQGLNKYKKWIYH